MGTFVHVYCQPEDTNQQNCGDTSLERLGGHKHANGLLVQGTHIMPMYIIGHVYYVQCAILLATHIAMHVHILWLYMAICMASVCRACPLVLPNCCKHANVFLLQACCHVT